jgi:SAM-dependent methyltransferase
MANFKPLKNYMLWLIDMLISKYSLSGPFLDVGCGKGDVSLHLAEMGWKGKAVDISPEAIAMTSKTLAKHTGNVVVENKDPMFIEGKFNTIFLCDVLEHIKDDGSLIENIRKNCFAGAEGTYLVVSVPVFMREWRWDDEFYGHMRRYEIPEMVELLAKNGFKVLDIWDFTFPVFWLLRRVYTFIFPRKLTLKSSKNELSKRSSLQSSWDRGILTTMIEKMLWWKPVFYLQSKFKDRTMGCECLFIAKHIG